VTNVFSPGAAELQRDLGGRGVLAPVVLRHPGRHHPAVAALHEQPEVTLPCATGCSCL